MSCYSNIPCNVIVNVVASAISIKRNALASANTLKIFRLVNMTNSVKKAMYFGGLVKKAKVFQGGSQIFA